MARFDMRRTADGLRTNGPVPPDHYFSADWIAERLAMGEADITITVNFTDGPVTWRLAGLEGEDGIKNKTSWHVVRDEKDGGS